MLAQVGISLDEHFVPRAAVDAHNQAGLEHGLLLLEVGVGSVEIVFTN